MTAMVMRKVHSLLLLPLQHWVLTGMASRNSSSVENDPVRLSMVTKLLSVTALVLLIAVAVESVHASSPEKFLNASKASGAPTRQISSDVFDCNSSNELIQAICKVALTFINKKLAAAGIMINPDELLFNYNDGKTIVLTDSCSSKTEINNVHLESRSRVFQRFDVMGNLLTEPLVVAYRLPIKVKARIDAKQRFGIRVLFCVKFPSDNFHINGELDTLADIVVGLSLKPTLAQRSDENYELRIRPDVALTFNLESTDLKFDLSGVSFLSKIVGTITGFINTPFKFFKAVISVFKGDKLKDIWKRLITDIGIIYGTPLVLGIGLLPRDIERSFYELFDNPIERKIAKRASGFGEDIEDKLNGIVAKALNLRSDGTLTIVIKKEIVDLVRNFGVDSDVFFIASPSPTTPPASGRRICTSIVCCAFSCGSCDDAECTDNPREGSICCESTIIQIGRSCRDQFDYPCTLGELQENPPRFHDRDPIGMYPREIP